MRVMGIDASSTTIGISIIDYDDSYYPSLVYSEYYKPNKNDGILNMLFQAKSYIWNRASEYKIDRFVIEDYVKFMKGASQASTTLLLAVLNMTIRLSFIDNKLYDINGSQVIPESLNVLQIRHLIKLTKVLPKKEEIPELVAVHLGIKYPWLYKVSKKNKETIMVESYDIADSMAVALAWGKFQTKSKKVVRAMFKKKSKQVENIKIKVKAKPVKLKICRER